MSRLHLLGSILTRKFCVSIPQLYSHVKVLGQYLKAYEFEASQVLWI